MLILVQNLYITCVYNYILCTFSPSYFVANAIGDIFKSHYTEPWPPWKKVPEINRDMWITEFMVCICLCVCILVFNLKIN